MKSTPESGTVDDKNDFRLRLLAALEASIAELKAEIEGAKDAKAKAEAEQKLATQESWLAAIGD